jgi:hypothetical protein
MVRLAHDLVDTCLGVRICHRPGVARASASDGPGVVVMYAAAGERLKAGEEALDPSVMYFPRTDQVLLGTQSMPNRSRQIHSAPLFILHNQRLCGTMIP